MKSIRVISRSELRTSEATDFPVAVCRLDADGHKSEQRLLTEAEQAPRAVSSGGPGALRTNSPFGGRVAWNGERD